MKVKELLEILNDLVSKEPEINDLEVIHFAGLEYSYLSSKARIRCGNPIGPCVVSVLGSDFSLKDAKDYQLKLQDQIEDKELISQLYLEIY